MRFVHMAKASIFKLQLLLIAFHSLQVLALPAAQPVLGSDLEGNGTLQARDEGTYGFLCKLNLDYIHLRGTCYNEIRTGFVYGDVQKASATLDCPSKSCQITNTFQSTSSQSFSINIGLQADAQLASDTLKGSASAGVSWQWSKSIAIGATHTYNLEEGEEGYIVFWPLYHESCGDLAVTKIISSRGLYTVSKYVEGSKTQTNTRNACGRTPKYLPGEIADGVWDLCIVKGPRKGKGCTLDTSKIY